MILLRRSGLPQALVKSMAQVLKFEVGPKPEDNHARSLDVPAGMHNVLEVRLHAPARSDVIAMKDFQRIFGAGDGYAGIGKLNRFGGATIVVRTADRNSDHIVGTQLERSRIKKAGRDLIVERCGRAVCLDEVEEHR